MRVVAPCSESPQKWRRRVGLVLRSPSSRRRALSSGLIARDQIARVKQAALEFRKAEHLTKVGAPMQKSISGAFAALRALSSNEGSRVRILLLASA